VIADLRGYTRYSGGFGDEAAAQIAVRFAAIADAVARDSGGELVEMRGDEALLVYVSARAAIEGAVELQRRCRGPDGILLPVGIGIDAGEPVAVDQGYRGSALNLAARLCSMAAPGQILASETTVGLAGLLDGLSPRELRPVRLKGIDRQVRPFEIEPTTPLPPLPSTPQAPPPPRRQRPAVDRRLIVLAMALLLLAALAAAVLIGRDGDDASGTGGPAIAAGSVVGIDPATGAVKHVVRVDLGSDPVTLAYGEGALWTFTTGQDIVQIDPSTGKVERSLGIGVPVTDIAAAAGAVWIASPSTASVLRLDPLESTPKPIPLGLPPGGGEYGAYGLALSTGKLWVAAGYNNGLLWIDTANDTVAHGTDPKLQFQSFYEAATTSTAVWVSENSDISSATKVSPSDGTVVDGPVTLVKSQLPGPQDDLTADDTSVWYVHPHTDSAYRIDPSSPARLINTVRVGRAPTGVALDAQGRAWVTNSGSGTVMMIDPESNTIVRTVRVGHAPPGIVFGGGLLWVAVQ